MASYDARGRGGWRPHVSDGVYMPVTSSIRPPDTHDKSCRRCCDHPADARRFELRRRRVTNGQALAQGPYLKIQWAKRFDFGWNSALFQNSGPGGDRFAHATPVPQKVVPAGSATQNSPY
ncbi:hypothetical protein THAOC_01389 [Thalassiosira oceanica]|uniref:Uncharacterized protein n=1 Tax=Thalassiosira oceanica TaxID=159749 RepID=K0TQX9_THAOC|nr:hypothetical protein THAOC_01389 [Thalassiosira oceanica]|eukprot:EJK76827.1 hypothetical protein THAOC_01389 [Thalassiosira oceanica]